jgi:hypothetical protein
VLITHGAERLRRQTGWDAVGAVRGARRVRFLLQGAGFAGLERVEVVALPRAPRTARVSPAAVRADAAEVALDPATTRPDRFECDELDPIYADLTRAIALLDVLRFRLDEDRYELEEALRKTRDAARRSKLQGRLRRVRATRGRVQDTLFLALTLGGDVEVIYGETCP